MRDGALEPALGLYSGNTTIQYSISKTCASSSPWLLRRRSPSVDPSHLSYRPLLLHSVSGSSSIFSELSPQNSCLIASDPNKDGLSSEIVESWIGRHSRCYVNHYVCPINHSACSTMRLPCFSIHHCKSIRIDELGASSSIWMEGWEYICCWQRRRSSQFIARKTNNWTILHVRWI